MSILTEIYNKKIWSLNQETSFNHPTVRHVLLRLLLHSEKVSDKEKLKDELNLFRNDNSNDQKIKEVFNCQKLPQEYVYQR